MQLVEDREFTQAHGVFQQDDLVVIFLESFGAVPVKERVVRDGSLITAGGVTSGIDFGLAVVAELLGREEAETIQLSLEYAPEPPFGSGLPETASTSVFAAAKARMAGSRLEREALLRGTSDEG